MCTMSPASFHLPEHAGSTLRCGQGETEILNYRACRVRYMEEPRLSSKENSQEAVRFEPEENCPPLTSAITGLQLAVVVVALVVVPVVIIVRSSEKPESYLT